jgi:hypothetical protein
MHIVLLARVVLVQCYAATSDEALHNYPATKPELAWKPTNEMVHRLILLLTQEDRRSSF